jgi:hypothetical protein
MTTRRRIEPGFFSELHAAPGAWLRTQIMATGDVDLNDQIDGVLI